MDVECSIAAIKKQLEKFPKSMTTYDQLHRLEIERVKKTGGKYRKGITKMLTSLRKKIQRANTSRKVRKDSRTKVNGGEGRRDSRTKVNGGEGRRDSRTKVNGGEGRHRHDSRTKVNGGEGRRRQDERNIVRGGIGRQTATISSGPVSTMSSTTGCNELRDFWWNYADDAAILASCCASHEAAMHTFWSAEEWMVHISATTTGVEVYLSSTNVSPPINDCFPSIIGTILFLCKCIPHIVILSLCKCIPIL